MANRGKNNARQDKIVLSCDHAQATADIEHCLLKAKRKFRVDSVEYANHTGLAKHADNFVTLKLTNGATEIATITTHSDDAAGVDIAADTVTSLTLTATIASRVLAKDDVLRFAIDATGSPTLPPGRIVVHGRYL